jgi:LmbE family N-acetylglucosaminyl deacetylase
MADIRKLLPLAAACAFLHAPLLAQQPSDPANLTYEHVAPQALADTLPINHGAPALQQLLVKLRTRASMMMIVAHPDDEDGGFLTYESRGQGARVAMLTLTRGEGGQNLMSADFDDALGLIRTQELLAADRYEGVDQYFGTEVDFGFSKTKEETLQKWTHDRVLYDAVRCVRLYRPLVLASVFVGGPTDGHGHHQVAGEIAQEVFLAAADPKVFPEMGLPPWAPLKVYARVPFSRVTGDGMFDYATGKTVPVLFHNYVTGQDLHQAPVATVQIHEGEKSTLIGMAGDSYIQFARKGLALQKTQIGGGSGTGRLAPTGDFNVGYTLMATRLGCINQPSGCPLLSDSGKGGVSSEARPLQDVGPSPGLRAFAPNPTAESSIFEGIDTSLPSIATLAPTIPTLRPALESFDQHIAEAQHLFSPDHPELTAPPLREALRTLHTLIHTAESATLDPAQKFNLLHELRIKRVQLNNALVLATGISLIADTPANSAPILTQTPGPRQPHAELNLRFAHPEATTLQFLGPAVVGAEAPQGFNPAPFPATLNVDLNLNLQQQGGLGPTRPYFSRPSSEQPYYDVTSPTLRNAPQTPLPFQPAGYFAYDNAPIEVAAIDQSSGKPLVLVAPVSVSLSPNAGIVPESESAFAVTTHVTTESQSPIAGSVHLELPKGWLSTPEKADFSLAQTGASQDIRFTVKPLAKSVGNQYKLTAVADVDKISYREGYRPVGYPGLTYTNYYTPATYRATAVDVTTAPNLHIAFLPGTGDAVPDFLPNLGVTPTILTLKDLTPETLANYDAVILGVRAYAAHPELAGPGSKPLLDYAAAGGIVILEYMTARYGDAEAPYPIAVPGDSAHNVVVEAEPVQLLAPANPLLTWPNKITSADFNNWVEERGHGFAATWSPEYTPLLETHDPDQDPQKGGLLLAKVGRGAYIYCALALYRQLPEGVPGAYRLMANLLSYAKNPQRR